MRYQRNSENFQARSDSSLRHPGAFGPGWRRPRQRRRPGKVGSMTAQSQTSADDLWGTGLPAVNSGTPPPFERGRDLMMRYRRLGTRGLRVSALFLGAMTF